MCLIASRVIQVLETHTLFKPVVLAWCALRHPWLKRRYRRLVLEEIDSVPLIVLPEVFNPVLLRSGQFLARVVNDYPLPENGPRVLDMGTGSGVGAVFAARRGARVVAVDLNPQAVRCARINALINGVESRVDVRFGDLMTPLDPQEKFDLVLFNPPYYQGPPADSLDMAWRGVGVCERFAVGLADVLRPGGKALVVFSSDGDWARPRQAFESWGFRSRSYREKRYVNEVLSAYLVEPVSADRPGDPNRAIVGGET